MKNAGPTPRKATASMDATKDPPTSTFASLSSSAAATFAKSAHRTSATPRDENSAPVPSASAAAVQAMHAAIAAVIATCERAGKNARGTTQKVSTSGRAWDLSCAEDQQTA